jgi:hypothetical protein
VAVGRTTQFLVGIGRRTHNMLWTIAGLMVILWMLGLMTSYTMGGMIHILLVVAIIMVALNLFQGRRTL